MGYQYQSKDTVEDTRRLTASFLRKHRYFDGVNRGGTVTWTTSGAWGEHKSGVSIQTLMHDPDKQELRIYYTQTDKHTDEKKDFDYRIPLTTSPCNYGGVRYWFVCPWYKNGHYCGRRVAVLYKGNGDYFACRHCYNLSYESRNEWKGARSGAWAIMRIEGKIEEIEKTMHKRYYQGKPTKKQRQVMKLERQINNSWPAAEAWLADNS